MWTTAGAHDYQNMYKRARRVPGGQVQNAEKRPHRKTPFYVCSGPRPVPSRLSCAATRSAASPSNRGAEAHPRAAATTFAEILLCETRLALLISAPHGCRLSPWAQNTCFLRDPSFRSVTEAQRTWRYYPKMFGFGPAAGASGDCRPRVETKKPKGWKGGKDAWKL